MNVREPSLFLRPPAAPAPLPQLTGFVDNPEVESHMMEFGKVKSYTDTDWLKTGFL